MMLMPQALATMLALLVALSTAARAATDTDAAREAKKRAAIARLQHGQVGPSPVSGIKLSGDVIKVDGKTYEHFTGKGLPEVLGTARATPRLTARGMAGFTLSKVHPGSVWAASGFRDGDVVTAIGGQALTDPLAAIATLQGLRGARRVEIAFERGGQRHKRTVLVE